MNSLKVVKNFIIILFIFIYSIVYLVTTKDKDELIENALKQQIEYLENNSKVSNSRFKTLSENVYEMLLKREDVLKLLYDAKHSETESNRAIIRKKLYIKMKPYFEDLTKNGVNIMMFSFENNKVFLRVHKPDKFNDDISSVRYSFTYVNKNKEPVSGFEQGKISHAFRNVFPLFYGDEYLGSVDISFSSEILQENMSSLHGIDTHFILNKNVFDSNLWKAQKKVKYIQSIEHEDFLFALTPNIKENAFSRQKTKLIKSLKESIDKNIRHGGSFALYDRNGRTMIIAFLPVKNIKDEKTVAYLVSYTESYLLDSALQKYILTNIILFTVMLLLTIVIYNNIKQRFYLQVRISKQVEKNKQQQQAMFEQSRLAQMGEMISMIAHQWRQPLASISSISIDLKLQSELELFDMGQEEDSKNYQKYVNNGLHEINGLVQNLTSTIDDFRNFYKPNKESSLKTLEEVSEKALSIIRGSLLAENIEIIYNYNSKNRLELYYNEMIQVILNILKNSQDNFKEKAIEKPIIKISTTDNSIIICDNGGGVPENIIKNIFKPYFSTKDEKNGTGLGLYMSKIIVEDHHKGILKAENKDDGVCFTIELNKKLLNSIIV